MKLSWSRQCLTHLSTPTSNMLCVLDLLARDTLKRQVATLRKALLAMVCKTHRDFTHLVLKALKGFKVPQVLRVSMALRRPLRVS